jgi:mRNA interferase MazF
MKPKKIVLTRFPFTDLTSSKRRPALVLAVAQSSQQDVIVAFISSVIPSTLKSTEYLIEVSHPDFSLTGLRKDSVVKLDKLATLDIAIFTGELGAVSDVMFDKIKDCLRNALDLL